MKILFTRFPLESAHGGAEVQTLSLMEGLRKKGHAVAFVGSCPVLLKECRARAIPTVELHIGPPPVTKWNVLTFAWRQQSMRKALQQALGQFTDLDAVLMLSLSEKLLVTDWLADKNVKVLWIEHDRVGRWLTKNPWLPRLRSLAARATTVGVSNLSRQIYVDLGWPADRTVAIPNGIDLNRFSPQKNKTEQQQNNKHPPLPTPDTTMNDIPLDKQRSEAGEGLGVRAGGVARLSPEKGIDILINAVADLPQVSLDIVGQGPDEGFLHKLIDELHQRERLDEPRVRIKTSVPDLGTFYRSLDVFVLPSRDHDPFGLTAAEAMSLGIATIVTDQCGVAGYLTNGTDALIVPANDVKAMQNALRELIDDPQRRAAIGEAGRRTAQETFAAERMIDAYDATIRNSRHSG